MDPLAVVSIEEVAKCHTHQDDPEPGKDRKVVQGIEVQGSQSQPEQPGKVDAPVLNV